MDVLWGAAVVVVGMFAWLGQAISAVNPNLAARLSLAEPEAEVDPAFYADVRGEAVWDSLSTWTLPVAGILLIIDSPAWPYFGLVGGATFLYFAGRGILARVALKRRGIRIGKPGSLTTIYMALILWGSVGAAMIAASASQI